MAARGIRNNNPLNIRKGNTWKGERAQATDRHFEEFVSLTMGIRAAFVLIRNYIEGRTATGYRYNTIRKIVTRWAPPSENITDRYVSFVCDQMKRNPDEVLYFDNEDVMIQLARSMAFVECGVWLDTEQFRSAYRLI